MNQFVILSFGVDPLNWPSFIEIGEIACSTPAWCTHGLTLKLSDLTYRSVDRKIHDGGYVEERVRVITLSVITSL